MNMGDGEAGSCGLVPYNMAFWGCVETTMTVGVSAPSAAVNSFSSSSVVVDVDGSAAEAAGHGGDVQPGQVESGNARRVLQFGEGLEDGVLAVAHRPRRRSGSLCWAAVHRAWMEYWKDPSPIRPITGRLTPWSRSPSATPTAAGLAQPMPPLAVAKNDPAPDRGQPLDVLAPWSRSTR